MGKRAADPVPRNNGEKQQLTITNCLSRRNAVRRPEPPTDSVICVMIVGHEHVKALRRCP